MKTMKKSLKVFISLMLISYSIVFIIQLINVQDRYDEFTCQMGLTKCKNN